MVNGRSYERSHPWITFDIRQQLAKAPTRFWIALGEAQSKCEHLAGTPLRDDTAQKMLQIYLAKGVAATTAIEGNTLTEEEVLLRLEGRLKLSKSREYLGKEIDNILHSCQTILDDLRTAEPSPITREFIKNINKTILNGVVDDPEVFPGNYTMKPLGVMRYKGAPPEDIPYLMEQFCNWMNSHQFVSREGEEIITGIIKSVVAHLYFVWIHPFGDGNGRTARVLEVKFLLEAGVPNVAAHLLSNHYNLTRTRYYRELDKTSRSGGSINDFLAYAVNGFVDQLRDQIEFVKEQQRDVAWENYVHEIMGTGNSQTNKRRRDIVLALSINDEPTKRSDIPNLSRRLAREFVRRSERTLSRDLNALIQTGLIKIIGKGYVANKQLISAFLPIRIPIATSGTGAKGIAKKKKIEQLELL